MITEVQELNVKALAAKEPEEAFAELEAYIESGETTSVFQACEALSARFSGDPALLLRAKNLYARFNEMHGLFAEPLRAELEEALDLTEAKLGATHELVIETKVRLADAYLSKSHRYGKREKSSAESSLKTLLKQLEKEKRTDSKWLPRIYELLAECHATPARMENAVDYLRSAREARKSLKMYDRRLEILAHLVLNVCDSTKPPSPQKGAVKQIARDALSDAVDAAMHTAPACAEAIDTLLHYVDYSADKPSANEAKPYIKKAADMQSALAAKRLAERKYEDACLNFTESAANYHRAGASDYAAKAMKEASAAFDLIDNPLRDTATGLLETGSKVLSAGAKDEFVAKYQPIVKEVLKRRAGKLF